MRNRRNPLHALAPAMVACLALALTAAAQQKRPEWAQWRGPGRDAISAETGLLKNWGPEGPKLLWKAENLGGGYSTPSLAGGRIYGMGYVGEEEVVWALDEETGRPAWSTRIAAANRMVGYGEGSRCTPTVDGDVLYAVGVSGDLVCLNVADGSVVWKKNFVTDFGGAIPQWGYTESPLVDGNRVIASPGSRTAAIVAFDKRSGDVLWKSQVPTGFEAAYSSAIVAEVDGLRQYVQNLRGGAVGVAAEDGRFLWQYGHPAHGIIITTPVFHDNMVFSTAAYRVGGGAVKLARNGDNITATEVYFNPEMQNHHGGVIRLGDHLYYFEGHQVANMVCREFKTGKLVWSDPDKRKGSLVYAEGHFYTRSERGDVLVVEATPEGFRPKGKFDQPNRSGKAAWAHPVIVNGKLYLRDQDIMLCYDIRDPVAQ